MTTLKSVAPAIRDIRELVYQISSTESRKKSISPQARALNWKINESIADPEPSHIVVFDDLIILLCYKG